MARHDYLYGRRLNAGLRTLLEFLDLQVGRHWRDIRQQLGASAAISRLDYLAKEGLVERIGIGDGIGNWRTHRAGRQALARGRY